MASSSNPPPPGPPSSAHQRPAAVYVAIRNNRDETEWYSFAINGAKKPYKRKRRRTSVDDFGSIPVVAPTNTKRLPRYSSFAALDSTIYCIGGASSDMDNPRPYYKKVRQWDTSSISHSWVRSNPIKGARSRAHAVALNGKIYVMDGVDMDGEPEPWAQVFDPQSGEWVAFDPPSRKPTSHGSYSAAVPSSDALLIGSCADDFLCLYYPQSNRWKKLHHEILCPPDERVVVVGNILVWFRYGTLYAYDLVNKWNSSTSIAGLENVVALETFDSDKVREEPLLVHIAGEDLGLIFQEYVATERRLVLLHFMKFRVFFGGSESSVQFEASVDTSQAYFIGMRRMVLDAVVLGGRVPSVGEGEPVQDLDGCLVYWIYVAIVNKRHQTEWYSFAINGAKKPYKRKRGRTSVDDFGSIPVVAPTNAKRLPRYSSFAALDSTIYCIGGASSDMDNPRPYYKKVRQWDTSSVSTGEQSHSWVRSTPIKGARSLAHAVALNGKIYVMDGVDMDGDPEPWAQVFDPPSGEWVAFDPPPLKPTSYGSYSAAVPSSDALLIGSCEDDFLCLYYPQSNRWKKLHHEIFCPPDEHVVVVGTILVWFRYGTLYAYDLVNKWNSSTSIEGLENVVALETFDSDKVREEPLLVHIAGEDLGLIFQEYVATERRLVLLHFIKFRVFFGGSESSVQFEASVDTSQAYFIGMRRMVLDAVLLGGRVPSVGEGEPVQDLDGCLVYWIYVAIVNKRHQTEWYSFAINGTKKPYKRKRGRTRVDDFGSIPVVAPTNTKRLPRYSSFAALDSTIYCIGGASSDMDNPRPYYKKVRQWDTSSVSTGEQSHSWVRSTPIKGARSLAHAVALNGKIYVMDGVDMDGDPEHGLKSLTPH